MLWFQDLEPVFQPGMKRVFYSIPQCGGRVCLYLLFALSSVLIAPLGSYSSTWSVGSRFRGWIRLRQIIGDEGYRSGRGRTKISQGTDA